MEYKLTKSFEIEKSGGEGSRGGKVIGHTKSGKPIYERHFREEVNKHFSERNYGGLLSENGIKHNIEHNNGYSTVTINHSGEGKSKSNTAFDSDNHVVQSILSGLRQDSGHEHNDKMDKELNKTTNKKIYRRSNGMDYEIAEKSHIGKIESNTKKNNDGTHTTTIKFHHKYGDEGKPEIEHTKY